MQDSGLSSQSSYQEMDLDHFPWLFAKAFVNKAFREEVLGPEFRVLRLLARDTEPSYRLKPVTLGDTGSGNGSLVMNDNIEATVFFHGATYEVVFTRFEHHAAGVFCVASALGLDEDAKKPTALLQYILRQGFEHSPYKNKFLMVKPAKERGQVNIDIEVCDLEKTGLNDVFLSGAVSESIRLFVDCIVRFDELRTPLRYLLSGKPGTAKTKTIRAIANEAQGKATFIFANGSDDRIDAVFEFAKCFSPVVVCIDDIDLLVGNRWRDSERIALGKFLQHLDGFLGSGIFVLTTTNDKRLVDIAASRPGRFDMILDLSPIDSNDYLKLISSKTNSQALIALFDEVVVDVLEARKVNGAFISTLIKHLEVVERLGEKPLDTDYVLHMIARMDAGFYKQPEDEKEKIGFTSAEMS